MTEQYMALAGYPEQFKQRVRYLQLCGYRWDGTSWVRVPPRRATGSSRL